MNLNITTMLEELLLLAEGVLPDFFGTGKRGRRNIGPMNITPETHPHMFMGKKGDKTYIAGTGQRKIRGEVIVPVYKLLMNKIVKPLGRTDEPAVVAKLVGLPDPLRKSMNYAATNWASKDDALNVTVSLRLIADWVEEHGEDEGVVRPRDTANRLRKYAKKAIEIVQANRLGRGFNDRYLWTGSPSVVDREEARIDNRIRRLGGRVRA